jgi:CBS domain containing-hemolysin-like protein
MLKQLIGFDEIRVRELMVPRSDIEAVDIKMNLDEVAERFATVGFSRMPAYDTDLDHIEGIIYAKDVFIAIQKHRDIRISDILRSCLMVPESQRLLGLLSQMKLKGSHIAILLDEYGGTEGLVTLSDLLAEIVGPIEDADDEGEEKEYERLSDGSVNVLARMHVEELEDLLGISLPEGDYDTVAGLILSQCGRIPNRGERINVKGLTMRIIEAEPQRILKVHVDTPDSNLET